jgi:hypothetical protein
MQHGESGLRPLPLRDTDRAVNGVLRRWVDTLHHRTEVGYLPSACVVQARPRSTVRQQPLVQSIALFSTRQAEAVLR